MRAVPLLSIAVMPRSPADAERMARALDVMKAEDPTISARTRPSGETVVGATGELQLDIILSRLAREFEVSATVERPQVGYIETVTREADGEMLYRSGTPAQYAHVTLTVRPREQRDDTLLLDVSAPLAGLHGYGADLRARTRGLGSFRISFDRYEPLQPADDDGVHGVREPLHRRPTPRSGSIALPLDEV